MLRTRGTGSSEAVISENERRNRRDLLFGARSNSNMNSVSGRPNGMVASEQEAIECANEEKVGNLCGQVDQMRHIAININEEVRSQNEYLDRMNNQFEHAGDMLNNSLRALQQLASGAGGINLCLMIVFAFFFLLAIWFFIRRGFEYMAALRVRVLCDGCERAVADLYCSSCCAAACKKCKTKLHNGCQAFDIANSAAVLALCQTCRARPAHRKSKGECVECRRLSASNHNNNNRSNSSSTSYQKNSMNNMSTRRSQSATATRNISSRRLRHHHHASGSSNNTSSSDDNDISALFSRGSLRD